MLKVYCSDCDVIVHLPGSGAFFRAAGQVGYQGCNTLPLRQSDTGSQDHLTVRTYATAHTFKS